MSAPATPSTINFVQAQPFVLSGSGSSIGDTTLALQSFTGIDGTNIVTADLGSFAYGTIEPGNGSNEEAILFTGVTQNANGTATLTGVSSLGFKQPYTLTSGIQKTHAGASKFIMSNDAAFYNNLVLYMNSIAGAGAANASTTVKGIVQAATSAQFTAATPTGSTGAVLVVTPDIFGAATTNTLSNKRITRRVVAVSPTTTPTINTDVTDVAYITSLATGITSFTTNLSGTPVNGDTLIVDLTDNGTSQTIAWGSSFESSGNIALPTSTATGTKLTTGLRWNVATSKWTCIGVA